MSNGTEKVTGYHWRLFIICFLGTAFGGTVSALMPSYLPIVVKDLLGNKSAGEINNISAYINAIFILGSTVGGFISGYLSDRIGRKKAVIVSIASYGIATLLTTYMNTWGSIVVCRFFSGFGLGAILVTGTTIMMEEWPQKTRAVFMGFLSISIPIGIVSAGLIENAVSSWRESFLVGILPIALAIISGWLLRESTTWKANQLSNAGFIQRKPTIFASAYRKDLAIGSIIFGTMLIGLWAIFSWLATWVQGIIVSGDGQQERGLSMMMLGMGGLTGGFVSGWLANAIGLRKSMMLCFAVCTICSFLLFKTNPGFSFLVYVEILLLAFFFGASQGILSVYIPSLFPVNIRGTATGFCFNIGRLLTALAVLFVGVLVTELGGYSNALLIFSSVFLIGLIVTFFTSDKVAVASKEFSDITVVTKEHA